jgi:hypothetical protein
MMSLVVMVVIIVITRALSGTACGVVRTRAQAKVWMVLVLCRRRGGITVVLIGAIVVLIVMVLELCRRRGGIIMLIGAIVVMIVMVVVFCRRWGGILIVVGSIVVMIVKVRVRAGVAARVRSRFWL